MSINYKEIADRTAAFVRQNNIELDFSEQSIEKVDEILGQYYDRRSEYEGEEDFLILNSHDGFLQFYGVGDQFVAEIRVNLPGGDFRTFSIIDKENEHLMERVTLTTPYGQYTPRKRDVVSLAVVREIVRAYYENIQVEDLLKAIPYVETTEETKKYMGL